MIRGVIGPIMSRRGKDLLSSDRCMAKRAGGDRCTRRRRGDCDFCGTHCKGTPNGVIGRSEEKGQSWSKVLLNVVEIQGIPYFISDAGVVYSHADVIASEPGPRVIGSYLAGKLLFF